MPALLAALAQLSTMFGVGLVSLALALAPFVNAAAPEWGQVNSLRSIAGYLMLILEFPSAVASVGLVILVCVSHPSKDGILN